MILIWTDDFHVLHLQALAFLEVMQSSEGHIRPDTVTYNTVLKACCNAGQLSRAMQASFLVPPPSFPPTPLSIESGPWDTWINHEFLFTHAEQCSLVFSWFPSLPRYARLQRSSQCACDKRTKVHSVQCQHQKPVLWLL